jgi:hypothetical protein
MCLITKRLPPQSSSLSLVFASPLLPGGCLLVLIHHSWACYSHVPHHYCQEVASPVLNLRSVMFLITIARRLPPLSSSLGQLCSSSLLPGGCHLTPQFLSFSLLCALSLLLGGCLLSSLPWACYLPQHYCQEVASSVLILWHVMYLITFARRLPPQSLSLGLCVPYPYW